MPSPPTPGAVAYTAYVQARYGMPAAQAALTYQTSIPAEQTAWEAAAQAALDQYTAQLAQAWYAALASAAASVLPRWQFAVGQHVRRINDPAQRWEIWYRTCREEHDRTFFDYGLRLVDTQAAYHPCRMSDGTDLTLAEDDDG